MLKTRRARSTVLVLLLSLAAGPAGLAPLAAPSASARPTMADASEVERVAQRAGISTAAARLVLQSESAEVQPDGTVVFVDDWEDGEPDVPAVKDRGAGVTGADLFALHSDPGASQTLYLDFDGAELVGTDWNTGVRHLPDGRYTGYSLDADPAFNLREQQLVEQTWRETSAFFAAFDVDVTTEEPPAARIARDGAADRAFGSWVVVSTDPALMRGTCFVCGGVAQLGVYGLTDGGQWRRPAFAFGAYAGTIAHEVGHQLGLLHDGVRHTDGHVEEYYSGHGFWEPIMGAGGVPEAISQWSAGDYPGATNTEDDYRVMAGHGLTWRTDRVGGTPSSAAPAPASGVLTETLGHEDVDVVRVAACAGALTTVAEVPDGGGLDLSLELLDASGEVVATAAHGVRGAAEAAVSSHREGQSEVLEDSSGRAAFVRITPGAIPGEAGYPLYGSIGAYRLTVACEPADPAVPTGLRVSASFRQVTLSWGEPQTGVVTGYRVRLGDRTQVFPAGARTVSGFAAPHDREAVVEVTAMTGRRAGPGVGATVPLPPMPTVSLDALTVDRDAGTASITWSGSIPPQITDARWGVYNYDTNEEASLPLEARTHTLGVVPASGRMEVELCLRMPLRENASYVVCDTGAASYPALAAAPTNPTARLVDWHGTVDLSWDEVPEAIRYEVSVDRSPWRAAVSPARLEDLDVGTRELRVRAVTSTGPGSAAVVRPVVRRAPSAPRDAKATPSQDGTRIHLSWERPLDDQGLTRYVLRIPSADRELSIPADATTYTLTGQVPGSRVDLVLSAASEGVTGGFVNLAVLLPGSPAVDPLPVPRIGRVAPGAGGGRTTVQVRWSVDAPRSATGWELSFTTSDPGRTLRRSVRAPLPTRTVEVPLTPSRRWRVRVRALGVDGTVGRWSTPSRGVQPR